MDSSVNQLLDKFENNYKMIGKEYKWSSSQLINTFSALIYTLSGDDFNKEEMESMHSLIKETTGIFSHYRGYDKFFISALLLTKYDNPDESFLKLLKYEDKLKEGGFSRGTYSGLAAYTLLTLSKDENVNTYIRKAKLIYDRMREKHFWLTGQDDYPLAILLSLSEDNVDAITNRVENLFNMLHNAGFSKTNSLQFLSHILSFGSDSDEIKVQKCQDILDYFKNKKIRINNTNYGTIGLMALMFDKEYELLDEIIEVIDYLKQLKEFKWIGKEILLLIASSIVTAKNIDKYKEHEELLKTNLGLTIQAIIAAQTAAMVASISAISAATAASASS